MKIQIITPSVVGTVSTDVEDGYPYLSICLKKPHYVKRIWKNKCKDAVYLAVEASNHLKTIGHADPLMHDIPKLVYSYIGHLK